MQDDQLKYWSDTIGFWVWGAKLFETDFVTLPIDGDSGSPISRVSLFEKPETLHYRHTPIGVLTTEHGEFAKMDNPLEEWNAVIWRG